MIDRIFDVLNSRVPTARGFKSPVRLANIDQTLQFLEEAKNYLLALKLLDNQPLSTSRR
jgi:hypothetical protein